MTIRILVIDDELARLAYKREEFLERWDLFPDSAFSRKLAFSFISSQHVRPDRIDNDAALAVDYVARDPDAWSLVLLDMQFDYGELQDGEPRLADPCFGLKIQAALAAAFPELPVVQFTAQTQSELSDDDGHYLSKLDGSIEDLKHQLVERGRVSMEEKRLLLRIPADTIVESELTLRLYAQVYRLAATDAPLLIRGEPGTGKEHLARYFHVVSNMRGPWLALPANAITGTLFESTLFGYEKGAFTGADKSSAGMFSEAADGTLFLDEIGALQADLQAKLLRAIGERRYRRIGSAAEHALRCRIVAATQDDLENNSSRADLWGRFSTVFIPPLRERPEEVGKLAEHFLSKFQKEAGKKGMKLSQRAMQVLFSDPFPDNSRSLEKLVRGAVSRLSSNSVIQPRDFNLAKPVPTRIGNKTGGEFAAHAAQQPVPPPARATPAELATASDETPVPGLENLIGQLSCAARPGADDELDGMLTLFDGKVELIRQELILAALHKSRYRSTKKLNIQQGIQMVTGDAALKGSAIKRLLHIAFGLPTKAPLDREWLQEKVDAWAVRTARKSPK